MKDTPCERISLKSIQKKGVPDISFSNNAELVDLECLVKS